MTRDQMIVELILVNEVREDHSRTMCKNSFEDCLKSAKDDTINHLYKVYILGEENVSQYNNSTNV